MSQPSTPPVSNADAIVRDDNRLVWVDMEMTGLDPMNDRIIEVAVVITNSNLDFVAEGLCWPFTRRMK